jgi:6-phosphogluconolactonase
MGFISRSSLSRKSALSRAGLIVLSGAAILVSGCGSFFTCEGKADCPTTGTGGTGGSTTVDYAYVANSSKGAAYVNGYDLSSGALTALSDSPISFSYSPSAMVVTPANTFLYAASDSDLTAGVGYIYGYSIGTGGVLSILSSGAALENEDVTSLAISPDGKWLFALDTDGITLEEYSINSSTGALTFAATYGVTGAAAGQITPSSVKIAPSGDYVVVALGTGGAETFSFDTTTGVATVSTLISPADASTGIYAVAVDSSDYLYCVGTAGLQVFSATTAGVPTFMKTYATGNGAHSVAINSASTYVYVGNETDSTISGYAIGTSAALTALTGSPYAAPATVNALAFDSTSAYLIASGYDSTSGIQLFTLGTAGALTQSGTAATGTSQAIPGAIAATH